VCTCFVVSLGCALLAAAPRAMADPEATAANAISDVAAQPARTEGLALTPEVSTIRTRLTSGAGAPTGPDGRPMSELAGVNYRVWVTRGRTDLGVGVGTVGYVQPGPDGRIEGPLSLAGSSPTVSVGLRYRVTPHSAVYADASGARGLGLEPNAGYVNTKVGLEWKPAKTRFGFDSGALGVRFDSGYRLTMKARSGGLAMYLKGQF
jgi:hypothetical protein